MNLKIAILAGDGIGPEIMKQGVAVLDAVAEKCGHKFEYEEAICGAHAIDAVGDPYPESTHEVCMKADAVLFAAVGDLRFDNNPATCVSTIILRRRSVLRRGCWQCVRNSVSLPMCALWQPSTV